MKNIARIAVISALMALGIAQSNAGFIGSTTNYTTNIVIKSSLAIIGKIYLDGNVQAKLTTKAVLTNIASELDITLEKNATLQLVHITKSTDSSGATTPLEGTFRVRLINGANTIDLSSNLGAATGQDIFNITGTIADTGNTVSQVIGKKTTERRILHISISAANLVLEAEGMTIIGSSTSSRGTSEQLDCDYAGDGSANDNNAVFEGGLDAIGARKNNATEIIITITNNG